MSQTLLSERLKELERVGIVERRAMASAHVSTISPKQALRQHRVDFALLGQGHHLLPLGAIELCARARLLEDAGLLVAGARGKDSEIALLARAGLIGGGDPAIEGGTWLRLSQLNPSDETARNSAESWGRRSHRIPQRRREE